MLMMWLLGLHHSWLLSRLCSSQVPPVGEVSSCRLLFGGVLPPRIVCWHMLLLPCGTFRVPQSSVWWGRCRLCRVVDLPVMLYYSGSRIIAIVRRHSGFVIPGCGWTLVSIARAIGTTVFGGVCYGPSAWRSLGLCGQLWPESPAVLGVRHPTFWVLRSLLGFRVCMWSMNVVRQWISWTWTLWVSLSSNLHLGHNTLCSLKGMHCILPTQRGMRPISCWCHALIMHWTWHVFNQYPSVL